MPLSYDASTPEGMAHLALGVAFSFNILFNYAMCVRSDPGSPPDIFASVEDGEAAPGAGLESADGLAVLGATPGAPRPRWCRKCRNTKPPLAHHCTVCGCVARRAVCKKRAGSLTPLARAQQMRAEDGPPLPVDE